MRFFAMQINRLQMTKHHYAEGGNARRMLVLHATAGLFPSDRAWLQKGGAVDRPISCHYYIDKAGAITQFLDDQHIAWHCGESSWIVDGRRVYGCNSVAIGCELSNANNNVDPYPPAQFAAAVDLFRHLVATYNIPRAQVARHLDISPGRKTDPAGFPWAAFVNAVFAPHDPTAPLATTPAPRYRGRWRLTATSWIRSAPWTKGPNAGRHIATYQKGTEITGELRMGETREGIEDWIAFEHKGAPAFIWSGQTERIA